MLGQKCDAGIDTRKLGKEDNSRDEGTERRRGRPEERERMETSVVESRFKFLLS